jgi:hypothetical protein
MLSNHQGILQYEGRTQVSIVKYSSATEINEDELDKILQEALLVDDLPFNKTKTKR